MPRIIIETKAPDAMRYNTLGDWFTNGEGDLVVQVSSLDGEPLDDDNFLIALHEFVEAKLCREAGISQETVDEFDREFTGDGEPGDARESPYRQQHRRAMLIEHLVADWLGLADYGKVE